ncbi:hypothetical protein tinsulaeT_11820 [Thalassotalea insulae]|uniref:Carrier domain-containing protein n=1 Tax=Thalassotalea insulae TaxID=2056778 RepID=A0ABQ6GR00_9GAMM|nr:hypothetical protein [Thalassotalea insulae]GLX77842.1 hypothetical protein tinsulaeT_11820 [Thalassotalea insulae]
MLIQQEIINFVKEKSGESFIHLSSDLFSRIKSFDFMLLILELEQKFNLQLPIEQVMANNIGTVGQFSTWVEQQNEKTTI